MPPRPRRQRRSVVRTEVGNDAITSGDRGGFLRPRTIKSTGSSLSRVNGGLELPISREEKSPGVSSPAAGRGALTQRRGSPPSAPPTAETSDGPQAVGRLNRSRVDAPYGPVNRVARFDLSALGRSPPLARGRRADFPNVSSTGLDPQQAPRQRPKERQQPCSAELLPNADIAGAIDAVHLEHRLGDVHAYNCGEPSTASEADTPPPHSPRLGLFDPTGHFGGTNGGTLLIQNRDYQRISVY